MFHFPSFPPHALYIQAWVTGHDSSWVSPFGNPRITARLPTPQGLSQAPTSFIGSRCQGIHHVPFVACLTNTQRRQHSSSSSFKNSYIACYKDRSLSLPANRRTVRERPKTRHLMVRDVAKMLASTMKESMIEPTESTRRLHDARYSGAVRSQSPDLSKLNSVPGPRAPRLVAGSTSLKRLSTERPLNESGVIHRRFH